MGPSSLKAFGCLGNMGPKTWFFKANELKFIEETSLHEGKWA